MFSIAALSWSQICFDLFQCYRQDRELSSDVWYWIPGKSADKFQSKKRTVFSKNRFMVFKAVSEVPGLIPGWSTAKYFETWICIYSHFKWLNVLVRNGPCLCVCVSVTAFYLNTIWPILMKLRPYDLFKNLRWHFFQIFEMLLRWRHSGHFVCFRMRHSHGRNFALIFFKITDKKVWRLPMFAIENQQNRLITSGRKSGPRFQKIAFLVFEPVSEVPGSIPGLGKKFFNLNFSSYDREWFLLCEKHRKWLNILLTLWCSCF